MCLFCDWGELKPLEDDDPVKEAERQRVSQDLWARLMEEIDQADATPPVAAEVQE